MKIMSGHFLFSTIYLCIIYNMKNNKNVYSKVIFDIFSPKVTFLTFIRFSYL